MKSGLFLVFTFASFLILGQGFTVVSGKVTESETGTPIPFATVVFVGTSDGVITDFDGNFEVSTDQPVDSLEVRYVGYLPRIKHIRIGEIQLANFQLDADIQTLGEVVVYAGENPAFPIMRQVVQNKKKNDKRALDAFEYEAYTKIEMDLDNISEELRRSKAMSKVTSVLDSIDQIAGEDGKPILPFFISEAVSQFYFRNNPEMKHENVLKTKITGVGVTDGTLVSQVIGASLQEYNFYRNWLTIVNKLFVSPIADGWRFYYKYDLLDSLYVGDEYCYRLDFYPRNEQDLAFQGTMWITKEDYALRRIDAYVPNTSNLNYLEKIKIQQDLIRTEAGAWLPEKSRVVVDVAPLSKKSAGFLAKFYISARDFVVNQAKPVSFFQNPVSMEEDVRVYEEDYWITHRHDSLTPTEENVYDMIDTLRKIPYIKTVTDVSKLMVNGYHPVGKLDLGPYTVVLGDNNIEGFRLGFGARTNLKFSNKIVLGGYLGYGFQDEQWKYKGYAKLILSRSKWTTLRLEHQREVEQIWLLTQNVPEYNFFYSFSRFGLLINPFVFNKNRIELRSQLTRSINQSLEFKHQSFDPLYDFSFTPDVSDPANVISSFGISEVTVTTRWAQDEIFAINDNERWSLGILNWPALTFSYSYGIPGFLSSDLEYHRFKLRLQKRQKMSFLGISRFDLEGGYLLGDVPYPVAFNPIGNETPVYAGFTYNLMDFFEFSSDRYVSFRYRHSFEGLIMNKIPLVKKAKLRLVGTANMILGDMKQSNIDLVNYPIDPVGNQVIPFSTFDGKPYVELGYGLENILKIFRIDAFHRITHTNNRNVNKFGLKFSMQFIL